MTGVFPTDANIISYGSSGSIKALNRRLHWGRRGIVCQHDPRHVDMLVKDVGLEHGNSVQTPATHDATEEEEPEPLDQVQHSKCRSQVASCLFPSQDRVDNVHRERVVSKDVKPHATELCQVEEADQTFEREIQWEQRFSTTLSDSDWAGCKDTRQSSSAGVMLLGSHTLQACTRKQEIIARSSAEPELYAAALGASESKGIVSLLRDLGYEMKPVLAIDAKATDHILQWMQDEIRSERLRVRRVKSEENVADLGTKPLSKAVIAKHCLRCDMSTWLKKVFSASVKSWRCSGTSCQQSVRISSQQVTMSRQQPAATEATSSNRMG